MVALREIAGVRQVDGEPPRRWFSSTDHDLIVWLDEADAPWAFQLTYDKRRNERMVTWRPGRATTHTAVDDGAAPRHKATALVTDDGDLDAAAVLADFEAVAATVPDAIRALVRDALTAAR